jgi:hypothetical protein
MSGGKAADRPYLEAWLRRTRRLLAPSGRLSELALRLSREDGGTEQAWRDRLRMILEGGEIPSFELLTRIESLLAGPTARNVDHGLSDPGSWF